MRSLLAWLLMATAAVAAEAAPDTGSDIGTGTAINPGTGPDPAALERLVRQDCGACHGMTLRGGLGPDIRPQALTAFDAETLRGVILDGIPETAMPPWRPLISEAEAGWIAEYLLKGERP